LKARIWSGPIIKNVKIEEQEGKKKSIAWYH